MPPEMSEHVSKDIGWILDTSLQAGKRSNVTVKIIGWSLPSFWTPSE